MRNPSPPLTQVHLTMVASRRPDLLERTLESFWEKMLVAFDIGSAIMNLDPIFGSKHDENRCVSIFRSFFPGSEITIPATPGLPKAIKTLWSHAPDGLVLHLEDDWQLLWDVDRHAVCDGLTRSHGEAREVVSLFLSSETTARRRQIYRYQRNSLRGRFSRPFSVKPRSVSFGTSPQISKGDFLRASASLIDTSFDAEKQMRRAANAELFHMQQKYASKNLWGHQGQFLIEDLGRSWRETKKIRKIRKGLHTTWEFAEDKSSFP